MFGWYTRPIIEFNAVVTKSLREIERALDDLAGHTYDLDWRLMQLETGSTAIVSRNYRTTYVIGLFGSGRQYIVGLILQNIGARAKFYQDTIHLHGARTPMIYSGHATLKHICRAQRPPQVTRRVLEAVAAGFADLIFIYRHPLDSLLSNWIWWRSYLRENRVVTGISEVFQSIDDLCACLEQNFSDFQTFAEGDPDFFADMPGERFLSFAEFVEETELYLQAATLALRFEDFAVDPLKQFSKIVELMSMPYDVSRLHLRPPKSKPYGYLAVQERVPQFRRFIDKLDSETKTRIQRIGYSLGAQD